MKHMELVYVEIEPGDTLFFHSNTLHRSDQNTSDTPGGPALLLQYQAQQSLQKSHHPFYEPIDRLPDNVIREMGATLFDDTEFWDPVEDETVGNKS